MKAVVLICLLVCELIFNSHAAFSHGFVGSRQCKHNLQHVSLKEAVANDIHGIVNDAHIKDNESITPPQELSEFYRRDPRDWHVAIADEIGLRQHLSDRFVARRERRYELVQEIDEVLKNNFGVKVYDNPNFWTTQRTAPPSHLRKRARKQMQDMKDLHGPTGHPYLRVGSAIDPLLCSMEIAEIHSLLSRRTRCLMDGNHDEADAIKLELLLHGVRLNDEWQQWRADGGDEFDKSWTESIQKPCLSNVYQQNDASQELPDESILHRVTHLVEMRSHAVAREEGLLATFLSLELYKTYNVGVDDVSKTWSFGCDFAGNADQWKKPEFPQNHQGAAASSSAFRYLPVVFDSEVEHQSLPYQPSSFSRKVACDDTLRRIATLVQERIHKREEHHFAEADAIRRELWATYYVGVNDRLRQWSVGGVF